MPKTPCFLGTCVAWNTVLRTRGSGVRIPSGALFIKKSPSAALATRLERADRTPDGQQDGSTTRRRTGLEVAASVAAVRSEAEDERRSREQSVRTLHSNLVEATN